MSDNYNPNERIHKKNVFFDGNKIIIGENLRKKLIKDKYEKIPKDNLEEKTGEKE